MADLPRVLFVDDEPRILNSIRRMLSDEDMEVFLAESGEQALQMLDSQTVDVIVSDERMPGMRGTQLLAEVRRRHPDTCRVILTGQADMDSAVDSINRGRIFRFLLKPVDKQKLIGVIHACQQERREEQRLLELSQQAGDVCSFELVITDDDTRPEPRWSDNAAAMLGLDTDKGKAGIGSLLERVHDEDRHKVRDALDTCLNARTCSSTEYRIVLPNGEQRWISQTSDILGRDEDGRTRVYTVLKDDTENHLQREQLEHMALHDALTGLPNRRRLMEEAERRLALCGSDCTTLFFIDMDDFKLVNDGMGHVFGDWLLSAFAERLEQTAPEGGLAARLGGDEFGLLLATRDRAEAQGVAEKLRQSLDAPFRHEDYEFFLSCTVGISQAEDATTALDLLREADTAMYEAKKSGKGGHSFFDASMRDKAAERLEVLSGLRGALKRDEFFLRYQPVVRLDTLAVCGYEALVRWAHPEQGEIPPGRFIPVAEESGLISALGSRVMEMACARLGRWKTDNPDTERFISFNVSARQLFQADLAGTLKEYLKHNGIPTRLAKVEITETGLMENAETSGRTLRRLKELGVELLIDDFGTGYSSLAYLQRIPARTLKVDRSFVMTMNEGEENRAIVQTIIDLARSLGMTVTAEGIETQDQLATLRAMGCDYGQGFLFDRPLLPDEAWSRTDYISVSQHETEGA